MRIENTPTLQTERLILRKFTKDDLEALFTIYSNKDGIPYITATHDINNPRSGSVMKQLSMNYQYSYQEQWQPKNILVTFRMYQLNFNNKNCQIYKKYWNHSAIHFIEQNI